MDAARAPLPLSVSPMIQRAVSPAAIGPAPVRLSPGSSAMVVICPARHRPDRARLPTTDKSGWRCNSLRGAAHAGGGVGVLDAAVGVPAAVPPRATVQAGGTCGRGVLSVAACAGSGGTLAS
jgi:hypothetical protein